MSGITVGSLFTGIGGFDLAAEQANMTVTFQSEVDKYSSRLLEHYWPNLNLGDIHDITSPEPVDVLCGGFPCQSYSVAGNRGGLAEDRGALWWEFHRLIRQGQPTWVVGENVPGLLSSAGGRDFATIIRSLIQLGYGVVWRVLDAQGFGVPQRRRRVFIVGHSGGIPRPEVLALGQGMCGHIESSEEAKQRASRSSQGNARRSGSEVDDAQDDGSGSGEQTIAFNANQDPQPLRDISPPLISGGHSANDIGVVTFRQERYDQWKQDDVASTLKARDYKDATDLIAFAQNQRDEVRDLKGTVGAIAAEPGIKQQTFITMPTVRRLTPLECERLQGFPDNWTALPNASNTQRYKQLGNAVAVPVVSWIMNNIAAIERADRGA